MEQPWLREMMAHKHTRTQLTSFHEHISAIRRFLALLISREKKLSIKLPKAENFRVPYIHKSFLITRTNRC